MKKLLNTLYIFTQGTYLHQDGNNVVLKLDNNIIGRLPIHTLESIVCFGNVLCTPFVLELCSRNHVHVTFLSQNGKFLARIHGEIHGNVLLRVEQMNARQNKTSNLEIAKNFISGKIFNSRSLLHRRLRDHGEDEKCRDAVNQLAKLLKRIPDIADIEELRGNEGAAALAYFNAFNACILTQKDDFSFSGRNKRPPRDNINAMLSYLYTLLAHDCCAALESVGLDPQIGFLHSLRPGRDSLALDLMEEFRAPFADRLALSMINLKQITKKDFRTSESGAIEMIDEARRLVVTSWQNRKKDIITHPFTQEKIEIGLLPFVQSQLLARHLRGDMDAYVPFLYK